MLGVLHIATYLDASLMNSKDHDKILWLSLYTFQRVHVVQPITLLARLHGAQSMAVYPFQQWIHSSESLEPLQRFVIFAHDPTMCEK